MEVKTKVLPPDVEDDEVPEEEVEVAEAEEVATEAVALVVAAAVVVAPLPLVEVVGFTELFKKNCTMRRLASGP